MKTYRKPQYYKERKLLVRSYKERPLSIVRDDVQHDFLKYIKVIKAWAKYKHSISAEDFDMICFLYSENIFSYPKFTEYSIIFGFHKRKLQHLMDKKYVIYFRKGNRGFYDLYELSSHIKHIMSGIYRKLLGVEPISALVSETQLIKKNNSRFAPRQYTRVIKIINKEFKERQLNPSRES